MDGLDMDDEDLQQMYQEVILDASRHPHGRESFAPDAASESADSPSTGTATLRATHEYCTPGESHQFNPTCGDEVTVRVEVSQNEPRRIERFIWDGHGCSISQASLSVMTDLVSGHTVDEALRLEGLFRRLMASRGVGIDDPDAEDALGDAIVFRGVSRYPMRIKCALLGWEGMKDSVARAIAAQTGPARTGSGACTAPGTAGAADSASATDASTPTAPASRTVCATTTKDKA